MANLSGLKHVMPNRELVVGSFIPGILNAYASYTLPIAAGADVVVTSDLAGVAGNALDFQATADGTAKAECVLTDVDASMGNARAATGGTGGNDWSIAIVPGSGGGEGVNVSEDTTNKVVTVMYESGVSTSADIMTAIDGTVNLEKNGNGNATVITNKYFPQTALTGGTAATWAEQSGSPVKMHLHFTDAVTTGTAAKNAINAVTGKSMTASGGDANTMAAGDAVAKQDLSGGVDAVAVGTIVGRGFSVTQTAIGEHTITMDLPYFAMDECEATLQLNSVDDKYVVPRSYTVSTKKLVLTTYDKSDGAAKDVAAGANNRINFAAMMRKVGG